MGNYVGIAVSFVFLIASISELRRRYSHEVYAIWYAFSLFFLIFVFLWFSAEIADKQVTDVLGPSVAGHLKVIYDAMTNIYDELWFVAGIIYLFILPQFLAYLLGGLSGSATPPLFIRQIATVAIWSLIKFLAALGGILLAHPLAKLALGKQISAVDFLQGSAMTSAAFFLAALHHRYFDEEIEVPILPGVQLHFSLPILLRVHNAFTRHTEQQAKSSTPDKKPEQWELSVPGIIDLHLRGPVIEELIRYRQGTTGHNQGVTGGDRRGVGGSGD